jgi:RNA polymerase sigma-70 factor (ECF subfamily)
MSAMADLQALREIFLTGQRKWPAFCLSFDTFREHCGSVLGGDGAFSLEAEALYLCCACAQGQPDALRLFESESGSVARAAIKRINSDEDFVSDTLQELWRKLLVGEAARVRSYSGRGPLHAWVRVAAARVALDRARSGKRGERRRVELTDRLADADVDLEAALLRARFGRAFQEALSASVASLPQEERNVLRMHVVGQCSIDEIARVYAVHRATAARRIERTRSKIYEQVREALQVTHKLTASEFNSLAGLLATQLELSLSAGPLREAPTSAARARERA